LLQHGKVVRFDDGLSMTARKPLELPPAVARAFVKDMKAFFADEYKKAPDDAGAFAFWKNAAVQYPAADPPNL
jgi:hypothetical protein